MKKEVDMGVKTEQVRLEQEGMKEASEKVLASKMQEVETKIGVLREKDGEYAKKEAELKHGLA